MKESALRFYLLATQLKYKLRSGWGDRYWNVSAERRESIAEHIYGTCILAITIDSEFETNVGLEKVVMMLVLHELGEVMIGDITPFDNIPRAEKIEREHAAVQKVLGNLQKAEEYYDLLVEFDERKTKEAVFAHLCDKLEADLQAKVYQDMGYQNPLAEQEDNIVLESPRIQAMIENGATTAFELFYEWDKALYENDESFAALLDYAKEVNTQTIIKDASA